MEIRIDFNLRFTSLGSERGGSLSIKWIHMGFSYWYFCCLASDTTRDLLTKAPLSERLEYIQVDRNRLVAENFPRAEICPDVQFFGILDLKSRSLWLNIVQEWFTTNIVINKNSVIKPTCHEVRLSREPSTSKTDV